MLVGRSERRDKRSSLLCGCHCRRRVCPISDSPSDNGSSPRTSARLLGGDRRLLLATHHIPLEREMPKKPKSGPPYTNIPDEVYVVVTNPWGMHSNPRLRGSGDFNRIASWAQFALKQAGLGGGRIPTIECIYGMGTVSLNRSRRRSGIRVWEG